MIELEGDIWKDWESEVGEESFVWRVVPVNGSRNERGQAVMGRGIAKQAQMRFPTLRTELGMAIRQGGNQLRYDGKKGLILFPVKHHWDQRADIQLIRKSCQELVEMFDQVHPRDAASWVVLMPRVGCGNGGLRWEDVEPILYRELGPIQDQIILVYDEKFEGS